MYRLNFKTYGAMLLFAMTVCWTTWDPDVYTNRSGKTGEILFGKNTPMPPVNRVARRIVHKVILFTYMRGGSTFLGQLFNQNRDVCYWFEPGLGMFEALYNGVQDWKTPLDIHYFKNGTKRVQSKKEIAKLAAFTRDLLNGDLDKLPLHVINTKFAHPPLSLATSDYMKCLNSHRVPKPKDLFKLCRNIFLKNCSDAFERMNEDACMELNLKAYDYIQTKPGKPKKRDSLEKCHAEIYHFSLPCLNYFYNACAGSSTMVIKLIRMNMRVVMETMRQDPAIKLVHYIRDPRGIVPSRTRVPCLSKVAGLNEVQEAKYICMKMMEDISLRKEIENSLPNTVITLRYEDYTSDPVNFAQNLYKDLGVPFPQNLRPWIQNNTSMGRSSKGVFSTMRENSSATASSWRTKLSEQDIAAMSHECNHLLLEMNYQLN